MMQGPQASIEANSLRPQVARTDSAAQAQLLHGVSRTFALTIPTLPPRLGVVVTNAYLLCRIADTIEDDDALQPAQKRAWIGRLVGTLAGRESAERFATELAPCLGERCLPAERELVGRTPEVVAVTHSLLPAQQRALMRCITVMSTGMQDFQRSAGRHGLADGRALDEYCYCVAGVVGEMLTELFAIHAGLDPVRYAALMRLAPSFGQGLQMTNILKDIHEDHARGVCWLPSSVFGVQSGPGDDLLAMLEPARFARGLGRLVGQAQVHLENAMRYTLLIPREQQGIRRFCVWALVMAVRTLGRIHRRPGFRSGAEVKISRRTVRWVVWSGSRCVTSNRMLRLLFRLSSFGLPRADDQPLPGPFRILDRLPDEWRALQSFMTQGPGSQYSE